MEPIPIQFIIGQLTFGGSERHLVDLVLRLDPALFRPQVICLRRNGPLAATLQAAGVSYREIPVVRALRPPLWELTRAVRTFSPRVVCVYTYIDKLWGRLAAILAGVPVVVSSFRGVRWAWYERLLLRGTTAVIANSHALESLFRARYGLPEHKVRYLPNGVDLSRFRPRHEGEDATTQASGGAPACRQLQKAFGFEPEIELTAMVARFNSVKDHGTALRAFALVRKQRPRARLALIGHGPREAFIRRLCAELGIADAVRLLPANTPVPDMFAAADLVLLTSRSESLPRVLVEAAACGRPTLATRVGGCPEVVLDGETGLLAEAGNPADVAEKWCSLLADPQRRARMGHAGRAFVCREHSLENMAARFQEFILGLLPQP